MEPIPAVELIPAVEPIPVVDPTPPIPIPILFKVIPISVPIPAKKRNYNISSTHALFPIVEGWSVVDVLFVRATFCPFKHCIVKETFAPDCITSTPYDEANTHNFNVFSVRVERSSPSVGSYSLVHLPLMP